MNKAIFITIIIMVLSGCALSRTTPAAGTYDADFMELIKVDAADGIDRSEAYVIAKVFFWSSISGCGFPEQPASENGHWISQTHIGYAGLPGPPISIDKATGTVSWDNGAKLITLEELKKSKY